MLDYEPLDNEPNLGGTVFCTKKSKTDTLVDNASSTAHHLVDVGADKLDEALAILSPLVATATEKASETASKLRDIASQQVGPIADQAREKTSPFVSQASERIAPLAATAADFAQQARSQASDRIAPLAATAVDRTVEFANQTRSNLAPTWQDAVDRAQPHLDNARSRVQDDLVPHFADLLHQATDHPAVAEATKRGAATFAAMKGDLALPEDEPRSRLLPRLVKVAVAGAVLAAAAVAVRQFLGSKDDGWTAHEPSSAYVPPTADATSPTSSAATTSAASTAAASVDDQAGAPAPEDTAPATVAEPATAEGEASVDDQAVVVDSAEAAQDVAETEAPVADEVIVTDAEVAAPVAAVATEVTEVEAPAGASDASVADSSFDTPLSDYFHAAAADQAAAEQAAAAAASVSTTEVEGATSYGEGAYVGTEPPAEYSIKGNERSMKYHLPESGGYERTIADVWFNSEEAAQAAGFTRAKR